MEKRALLVGDFTCDYLIKYCGYTEVVQFRDTKVAINELSREGFNRKFQLMIICANDFGVSVPRLYSFFINDQHLMRLPVIVWNSSHSGAFYQKLPVGCHWHMPDVFWPHNWSQLNPTIQEAIKKAKSK